MTTATEPAPTSVAAATTKVSAPVPVAAVIPCFRCTDTISRAVGSVVRQTRRPRELFLVDDRSDDGTVTKLEQLRDEHGPDWIRVLSLDRNGGPSAARNAGWGLATQPYVAFLDADDAWHPEKLEIQYEWMRARPEVALTGHAYRRTVSGREDLKLPGAWGVRRVERHDLLRSNRFPTRTVMLKRELPVRFTPEKRRSEDYLVWLELILRGNVGYRLDVPLAFRYKAPFGEGGLSGDLWKMEKGELDCYSRLWRWRLITLPELTGYGALSIAKFLARVASLGLRRFRS